MSATLYIIRRIYTWINTLYIQIFCIFVKSLIFSNRQYEKIQGTCFKLQAMYFEIHALYFLLYALYGFDWRKNILKSRNKWIYATAILHDFDYFYSRFPLEHNSMRLIVLIRSFNPRRTQFILQNIETRGKSFNPRAHTGRDLSVLLFLMECLWFQSTRPHGARLQVISKDSSRIVVSIHAPTRGATALSGLVGFGSAGFNPRAHTGRDRTLNTTI